MQNITNEQFCIQVMLYTRTGGGVGGLQICSTVHVIAILRIYRRSLNDSNQSGNPGMGRGGSGGAGGIVR